MPTEKKRITEQMYKDLQKPLPAKAVQKHPTKTFLSTIKAIYVIERLNDVFGLGMWKVQNEVIREDTKHIVVKSCLTFEEYSGYFESFGGNDNPDLGDAYKGACTDALTKIGSYLGVAMEVFKGEGNTEKPEPKPQQKQPEPPKKATPAPAPITAASEFEATEPTWATSVQKEEIIQLLQNPVVTKSEREKMAAALGKLNIEKAAGVIQNLKDTIKHREAINAELNEQQ